MMKPKFKSLCFIVVAAFIVVYACNKKDVQLHSPDEYKTEKNWIHLHGGTYSNETITIQTKSGAMITGSLNWEQIFQLTSEGKQYL